MLYEFSVYQMKVEEHLFWVAESKSLKGCVGQGETSSEAIRELEENEKEWLETARQFGIPIPPVSCRKEKTYSGKVSLRMSPYVHEKAAETAIDLGISLNQFVNDAIIEYTNKVNYTSHKNVDQNNELLDENIISFTPKKDYRHKNTILVEELEEM